MGAPRAPLALVVALAAVLVACGSPGPGGPSAPPAPPPPPQVTVAGVGQAINPTTPITVHADTGRLTSVSVTNPRGKAVAGAPTPDGTGWTTTEPLGYGTTYQVVVDAVSPQGVPGHETQAVSTLKPADTADVALSAGGNNGDVGVGQPVSLTFSSTVHDRAAVEHGLSATSNPPQPGAWHWVSPRQIDYRPQQYWAPGTTVDVNAELYGVDLGGGTFGGSDASTTFHTHDAWIAEADGSSHQMTVRHNGDVVRTMDISLGDKEHPTHSGPHVVSTKSPSTIMDSSTYGVGPGQPGYYRETVLNDVRISNDGEFVHSAPWSVGDQGSSNVSHGCVNLSPADSGWFYSHFGPGDVVEVTNSGGPALPLYDTWGDWALPWEQWSSAS